MRKKNDSQSHLEIQRQRLQTRKQANSAVFKKIAFNDKVIFSQVFHLTVKKSNNVVQRIN